MQSLDAIVQVLFIAAKTLLPFRKLIVWTKNDTLAFPTT